MGISNGGADCPCFRCSSQPCAPPACQVCDVYDKGCPHAFGCYTNASAKCSCSPPSWPNGKGCTDATTEYVHWMYDASFCCQIPKVWMTEVHNDGGDMVPPTPYPYSSDGQGGAVCAMSDISKSASFQDGTCKAAGNTVMRGGCSMHSDDASRHFDAVSYVQYCVSGHQLRTFTASKHISRNR